MTLLDTLPAFLISLGIGLLMGLERERKPDSKAGLRTFALVALCGTSAALLSQHLGAPWLLAAGFAVLGLMMIAAHFEDAGRDDDPGTTSTVAVLLCYSFGAMLWYGHVQLTVALALAATTLLYFKAELHGVTERLTRQDIVSFLQFAVVTFIVLPVLPDQAYGPFDALNPYRLWLMVVLISGLSLGGYAVLRLAGPDRGVPVLGLLGGVVSSTATTMVFSRHTRTQPALAQAALIVILLANVVVLLRLAVITGIVAPSLLPALAPMLGGGVLVGALAPAWAWWRRRGAATAPSLEVRNPTEMGAALGFGALYAVVLFAVAWLHDVAGSSGVYTVALVAGLTDVDAITLSTLQLFGRGQLSAAEVTRAILLAYASNLGFKLLMVAFIAGRALALKVAVGFAATLAGLLLGLAVAG